MKPANVCYEGQTGVATIVDLGNSVVCLPGYRSFRTAVSVRKTGLHYQTLGYRAIELALGDSSWEKPTDCWAVGLLIAELWGLDLKIFRTLGSPTVSELPYFSTLPLFSPQKPSHGGCRSSDRVQNGPREVRCGSHRLVAALPSGSVARR
jgi:hypothetical protein